MEDHYFQGKGLDVSEKKVIENSSHFYAEPNNFYRLNNLKDYESFDFVYSKNLINKTKFFKVLLKEWSYFCKRNGHIIIEFEENAILDFKGLLSNIELLLGKNFKIVEKHKRKNKCRIILKKLEESLIKDDSIDKWTFGILSDGSKIDVLENQIQSIIALKIPNYEIIVCGPYENPKKWSKIVENIPFDYKIAWITKKKNLIAEKAKYENLVITHNRFNFDKNWFEGMKKYGNYFEVLMCKILSPSGRRAGDWLSRGIDIRERWYDWAGLMEYYDWDSNLIINGSFYILKKSAWKKSPWNEALVWGQKEDDVISYDFHKVGIVPRFNPNSTVHTFPERYGNWNWKYTYNSQKLGRIPFSFKSAYFKKLINYLLRKYLGVGLVVKANCNTYGW